MQKMREVWNFTRSCLFKQFSLSESQWLSLSKIKKMPQNCWTVWPRLSGVAISRTWSTDTRAAVIKNRSGIAIAAYALA